jgi:ferrous iron transport protein B
LRAVLARDYSPLVGLSMMLFLLIATPCLATVAVTRKESGSWRYALLQLGGLTAIAYLVSLLVYQTGRLCL